MPDIDGDIDAGITILPATIIELSDILACPTLLESIGASGIRRLFLQEVPTYIVTFKQYKLLYTLEIISTKGCYEMHFACPKQYRKAARVLIMASIQHVFSEYLDAEYLVTSCPEGKMSNMAYKMGGKLLARDKEDPSRVHLIIKR